MRPDVRRQVAANLYDFIRFLDLIHNHFIMRSPKNPSELIWRALPILGKCVQASIFFSSTFLQSFLFSSVCCELCEALIWRANEELKARQVIWDRRWSKTKLCFQGRITFSLIFSELDIVRILLHKLNWFITKRITAIILISSHHCVLLLKTKQYPLQTI
jgi:hypothetical protein